MPRIVFSSQESGDGTGIPGINGTNGWTPYPTAVTDGDRQVVYITWENGTGAKPDDGYLSNGGITDDITLATSIGSQSVRYEHQQPEPSNTWNIQHNLGEKFVEVLITDETGNQIEGSVDYAISTNNLLTISFANAVKGMALIKY